MPLHFNYFLNIRKSLSRQCLGHCNSIVLRKVGMPWEGHKVIHIICLVELPDQEANEQSTVVVVVLIIDVEDLERALLFFSFKGEVHPLHDNLAPIRSLRLTIIVRYESFAMLLLIVFYRIYHINLRLSF
jgi:hypothetical protein